MSTASLNSSRGPLRICTFVCGAVFLVGSLAGCSHAEYDIVRPADLTQHIGEKQWVTAPMGPIEYRMVA